MLTSLWTKLSLIIIGASALFVGFFGGPTQQVSSPAPEEQVVGATIPVVISLFETSLQSSISDSATSMTLVSGTDRAGTALSGYMCFTLDEGTSAAEFVCGSASSTSVTSLTRGISPLTGTSSVASLKYAHRRGASVKVTNYPQLAIVSRILNGNETLPNPIVYDSSISATTLSGNTSYLANVAYVNGVALQGAPTATGTTPGLLQIASRTQLSSGTAMDGAYTLVPSNAYFTYNPLSATSVPVSNSSGKIAQGWLNLSESFTFSGVVVHSATTTLATTTITSLSLSGFATAPTTTPISETNLITKYYVDNSYRYASTTDNLRNSADTERSSQGNTTSKRKEIQVYNSGTMRIKYDLKTSIGGNPVYGYIYINGTNAGTERSDSTGSYVTFSEDIIVSAGDKVQLYTKCTNAASESAFVQNFRFYYDVVSTTSTASIITD